MNARILCIAPYSNYHPLHGMWEITLLQALRLRGAEVAYYLCDGLSQCCDIFRIDPASKNCTDCMARSSDLARAMLQPFQWLGQMLTPEDAQLATDFALAQPVGRFFEASFEGRPVGQWIQSTVHTYFREAQIDQSAPEVEACCRAYLQSSLLFALASERLIDDFKPTALLLFNTRMALVKAVAATATARGIPFFSHERGWLPQRLALNRDDIPMSRDFFDRLWRLWGDIPLTTPELREINSILRDREHGKGLNWTAYSPPPGAVADFRRQLGLSETTRIWGLFTSSEDEVVSLPTYQRGVFETQPEWIVRTLAFIRRHPEVHLVVRVHPNTGGKKSGGVSRSSLRFFRTLASRLPKNATLVAPDDPVSTYDLMAAAEVGLVYLSTCGLEMACRGKAVISAARAYYSAAGVTRTPRDTEDFDAMLADMAAAPPPLSLEAMRLAHRFFYASFYRADIPFPLVSMPTPYTGKLAYATLAELAPGREPHLDAICRMILDGAPLVAPPGEAERRRDESDELAWFTEALAEPETPSPHRPRPPEARDQGGHHMTSGPALETPILFMVFNRPQTTAEVMEAIRRARPRRLFIAADGPRPQIPADAENCRAAREVALAVDWDCEVTTLLRKRNLGCRTAVNSAITWFFQHVPEGVILEDDTLPVPGFFDFCQALLARYRDDPRVMHIAGNNFQLGARHGDGSYYFSIFSHIWGWATWRRAWTLYDPSARAVSRFRRSGVLERLLPDPEDRELWLDLFERTAQGGIDTWDYPWTMSIWNHGGLAVLPNVNMVGNIGFGAGATHTVDASRISLLPVCDAEPLKHPSDVAANAEADAFYQAYILKGRIENAGLLCGDVASLLERERPGDAAALARRFLNLHPEDLNLQWLEMLALALAGDTTASCGLLEKFLAQHPDHEGARSLLASIRKAYRADASKR